MESKKDIGKFFKDKLEKLDNSPSASLWKAIEEDLNKKKKRRRAIIWFFFGLLLFGTLGTFVITNSKKTKSDSFTIDNSKATKKQNNKTKSNKGSVEILKSKNDSIFNSNQTIISSAKINEDNKKEEKLTKTNNENSNKIATNYYSKSKNKNNRNKIIKKNKKIKNSLKINQFGTTEIPNTNKNNNSNSSIKTTDNDKFQITNSKNEIDTENNPKIDSLVTKKQELTENKIPEKEKDSTKSSIENKHEIVFAPYFGYNLTGSFSKENTLTDSNNKSKGQLNTTFGILARWFSNEKFAIQTGIGLINTTQTVETKNLNYSSNKIELSIPLETLNANFNDASNKKYFQEISYIEVPLEGYYVLQNKKIGMATSFGISLLFINKNEVFLESETVTKMKIGQIRNATNQSYTANSKINFFYKITPNLQFDLYPSIQFQFMGNKDNAGYIPYFVSLKTGLNYKF